MNRRRLTHGLASRIWTLPVLILSVILIIIYGKVIRSNSTTKMTSPLLGKKDAMTSLEAREKAFFLDGQKVMLFSGAMHYFRVVPEYWKDRMLRMKACGLNTLETYVAWNLHEEVRGEFNFEGILDIRKFVQTAQEVGLYVLLRPGPYICSEWDFGGLPSWLLSDTEMKVRSSYEPYLHAVDKYFSQLLPLVVDLQLSNGGPIIAVQIENEYGSYGDDMEYKMFLKQNLEKYGINELLFTSDNGMGIQRGDIPGALITANFQEKDHGYLMYEYLKNIKQPDKPLMVMEFWSGWFDHWGHKHEIWPLEKFEEVLRWLLEQNSSINFYMMHGGTNFGFMNGANQGLGATNEAGDAYEPDVTSYDYDAPISENGDITEKGHRIKELLTTMVKDYMPDSVPDAPDNIPKEAYGEVKVTGHLVLDDLISLVQPIESQTPVAMEMLDINNGGGQGYGFIIYRKVIGQGHKLMFKDHVKDRAQVIVNDKEIDVVHWTSKDHVTELPTQSPDGMTLDILVENLGRVNYADFRSPLMNMQRKGLLYPVLLDGVQLKDWQIYPLEFKSHFIESISKDTTRWHDDLPTSPGPVLCRLNLHISGAPTDTYINMKGWTKGQVFVNKFNLGRYWEIGPQESLYVPGPLLNQGDNQILVFELHKAADHVVFESEPSLGEPVIHKTVIPVGTRFMVGALRCALRLGDWVWCCLKCCFK